MFLDELLDSLNGMQKFMTGDEQFNHEFYEDLVQCLNKLDPRLHKSVNAQWTGFKEYAASGGNPPVDVWQQCPENYQVRLLYAARSHGMKFVGDMKCMRHCRLSI